MIEKSISWFKYISLFLLSIIYFSESFSQSNDTLIIKLQSPKNPQTVQYAYLSTVKGDQIYQPDTSGKVMITDLSPAKYILVIDSKKNRQIRKKIYSEDFDSEKVLEIYLLPDWIIENKFNLQFTQIQFGRYWQTGGIDAISVVTDVSINLNYNYNNFTWDNQLDLGYGLINREGRSLEKNKDIIAFETKVGWKINRVLSYSFLTDFRSQFAPGFQFLSDGSRGNLLSDFLSPAYVNGAMGIDYRPSYGLSLFLSVANLKLTYVRNDSLTGNFLPDDFVEDGIRFEIGGLLNASFQRKIWEDIFFNTKLNLFVNYIRDPSADIFWDNALTFKVNKYISAKVEMQVKYDRDVTFVILDDDNEPLLEADGSPRMGPRTQFRQSLSIGLSYLF